MVVQMTVNTSPLTDAIDHRALRSFRRELPSSVRPGLGTVLLPTAVILLFPILLIAFDRDWAFSDGLGSLDLDGRLVPFLVMPLIGIGLLVRSLRRRTGVRQFRIHEFARANSLTYAAREDGPRLPGMIFTRRGETSSFSTDVVRRPSDPSFVVANHTLATGSGKNRKEYRWGYAVLRLAAPLPHIVLDAQRNNSWGKPGFPVSLAERQRLSLEGDFDRYFALYCPEGYEADALYLFTPDTMARLIDNAALFDIEIIDDYLFLYAPGELSTLDPALWREVVAAIDVLSDRVAKWARWRDERLEVGSAAGAPVGSPVDGPVDAPVDALVGTPVDASVGTPTQWGGDAVPYSARQTGVATPGRRLARRNDWWRIIIAVPVLIVLYNIFTAFNR
jgi:hypothetical protein